MRGYLRKNNNKLPTQSEEKSQNYPTLDLTFITDEHGRNFNHIFKQLLKHCGFL